MLSYVLSTNFMTLSTLLVLIGVLYGFYVAYHAVKTSGELGDRMGKTLTLFGEKDGALWRTLSNAATKEAEKPLVTGWERAVKDVLGLPKTVHTDTISEQPAPKGFVRCNGKVTFSKGEMAETEIAWDEQGKLASIKIFPESGPLCIYKYLNTSAFEQMTDDFIHHLFNSRISSMRKVLHVSLRSTPDADLTAQGAVVASRIGLADIDEIDVTHQSHSVGPISASQSAKCLRLTFSIRGEDMDAEGYVVWVTVGMLPKILKFEVKTTGKPKRETVFVNPDGSRIESYD